MLPVPCANPSQVADDANAMVGIEPMDYQVFEVDAMGIVSTGEAGASPNESSATSSSASGNASSDAATWVTSTSTSLAATASWSKLVSNLDTGKEYYVRVSADGDGVGYGEAAEASSNPVVPRGVPGQIEKVSISRVDAATVRLEIEQNTETNGAEIEGYTMEWDTSPQFTSAQQATIAPDYRVQAVRLNAWQRGWTSTSAFSLSLFDFRGAFNARLGGLDVNELHTFVSVSEGANVLSRTTPVPADGFGDASLHKVVPRGGFVRVGGQDFRVCLDGDLAYDDDTLTLCSTSDPYVAQNFVGAATSYDNTLTELPAYVLDTAIGSAYDVAIGDTALQTYIGPATGGLLSDTVANDLTSVLARGDHVRLGHPETGRVFTVCKGDGATTPQPEFSATSLPLCSADDPEEEVSVLAGDIVSATYEIQRFGLTLGHGGLASGWADTEVLGYRLTFGDETSAVSQTGGHAGCLSFYSTAEEVKQTR